MSLLYEQYKTDKNAETNGVRIVKGNNADGSEVAFTLARMAKTNPRYAKALEAAVKPHLRELELETFSNEQSEALYLDLFCRHIVLSWENVRDAKGQDLPFTPENAVQLFTDLPELYWELRNKAEKAALFRDAGRQARAKN